MNKIYSFVSYAPYNVMAIIIFKKKNHKTFFPFSWGYTRQPLPFSPLYLLKSSMYIYIFYTWYLMDMQLTPRSCHQGRGKRTGFKVSPLQADITWLGVAENMGRIDSLRRGSGQWIFSQLMLQAGWGAVMMGWVVRRTVCKCRKYHENIKALTPALSSFWSLLLSFIHVSMFAFMQPKLAVSVWVFTLWGPKRTVVWGKCFKNHVL